MLALAPRDLQLLDRWQRDFPLVPSPFAVVARHEQRSEAGVIAALRGLAAKGVLSRVGAVVRPNTAGASLLAAMRVPDNRLEEVAAIVNGEQGVNHNYEREHAYNLWFVMTASDTAARDAALGRLRTATGLGILELPLLESFYIDLGFGLASGKNSEEKRLEAAARTPPPLDAADRRLIGALDKGLALVSRPYAALGLQADLSESEVIERLAALTVSGLITRFGLVVRHRPLGFTANAMAVWDVPDADIGRVGALVARQPCVTLCYRRPRHLPHWPYNLFAMVHGKQRDAVAGEIAELTQRAGLEERTHAILFSRRCFRQRGARFHSSEAEAKA